MTTFLIYKSLHIFFMVAWFAGIFYLPRLFVYHAMTNNKESQEMLKIMERKLLYFVTPFAILTLIFGSLMIYEYGRQWFKMSIWLHIKLVLVIGLYVYHGYCFKLLADFKQDKNTKSDKFYRIINELPVLVLLAIIFLAILKPLF
ncbi:CopD family protein [Pseudoalteromonas denitrificans]|uniref:Protoporphyrinogen IX oxidase n=1 Tax=Pseudoalteromonas denitrificans DSM 6059 TaxID=1123010 RepID=A0A1I1INE3_9GAMM|nr:CopD family protein [Pseudoalteromonas denitrificans]SFC35273.1 putative membrane protein [Pseudoalteromonas denitrificans DSM 6059]